MRYVLRPQVTLQQRLLRRNEDETGDSSLVEIQAQLLVDIFQAPLCVLQFDACFACTLVHILAGVNPGRSRLLLP